MLVSYLDSDKNVVTKSYTKLQNLGRKRAVVHNNTTTHDEVYRALVVDKEFGRLQYQFLLGQTIYGVFYLAMTDAEREEYGIHY